MNKSGHPCNNFGPHPVTRREMLMRSSAGFGSLALTGLFGHEAAANPMVPRVPHFTPSAKRVIFLFMHGGPSQVDTFDYKPALQRDHGKPYPGKKPRIVSSATANLLASPFKFKQHGQSGRWVSEIFPHVGAMADELCVVNSVHCSNSRHGGALLELHTGSDTFIRPSMGSWITYGLGTENQNLPGYITICPTQTHGAMNAWSSAFLPAHYHGTRVGLNGIPADKAKIPFIENEHISRDQQRLELNFLADMNVDHLKSRGKDDALETRIASFELAFRMQTEAPTVQDISKETEATKKLYGLDNGKTRDFGIQCLLARRFAESGVRFVQATHSYKWDAHQKVKENHSNNAAEVDKPIAGLLKDLKARGLLEDTLVMWGGEFGRTPVSQSSNGRDHNPHAMSMFFAGAGIKPGIAYGSTDEHGYYAVENKVHYHDVHATLLHLLGLDHTRLTYRYVGRDFRLTDIHGEIVRGILA